ncbi:TonB-system energizer ExbB [Thiomicrorhabdus lithotrophica]|uniref:TonB-system energizer ExbB n=1 Tax=Thiomicrorhabdus lithotrophica TaxID=2949997 RepID=A0ABY8CEQ5_9GAMM|nr:TonB-system energizer ExbB [Thiomicrorhabdus lithotrophica]WEJ63277.1 TonB-system energizer ExbB [Thiomicrorhabdus lithotrophica]
MELLKEYLDLTIFGILGIMGFITLWVAIERVLFYRSIKLSDYNHGAVLNIELTRNLTVLSIVGSNAPFVGLLGTVVGVLITFYDMGQNQAIDTGSIMTGLALALKATAAGIAIAIPAIMIYNSLMRKVDVINSLFRAETQR